MSVIKFVCKDGECFSVDIEKNQNFIKSSEFLKDLLDSNSINDEIELNQLSYEQIQLYSEFSALISNGIEGLNLSLISTRYREIKEDILVKNPNLFSFIVDLSSIDTINKFYKISDYLRIKILDLLLIIKCFEIANSRENEIDKDRYQHLKQLYLKYCEIDDPHDIDELIEN